MYHFIHDLMNHPKVIETQNHMHHNIPKYDHLMRTVKYSGRIARLFRADERVCVRAAMIHDIDSRDGTLSTHGIIAARWAARQGEPEEVCEAIKSHMYPIGPFPSSREAWVLVVADKVASLGDFRQFVRGLRNGSSIQQRRYLRRMDPFYMQRQPMRLVHYWRQRSR